MIMIIIHIWDYTATGTMPFQENGMRLQWQFTSFQYLEKISRKNDLTWPSNL